jgi:hypothetical protein
MSIRRTPSKNPVARGLSGCPGAGRVCLGRVGRGERGQGVGVRPDLGGTGQRALGDNASPAKLTAVLLGSEIAVYAERGTLRTGMHAIRHARPGWGLIRHGVSPYLVLGDQLSCALLSPGRTSPVS